MFTNQAQKYNKHTLNQTGDIRIVDYTECVKGPNNYASEVKKRNEHRLRRTLNGFSHSSQFAHLQIKGRNKLVKEIEETKDMKSKVLDYQALHRNEITEEIEGTFAENDQHSIQIELKKEEAERQPPIKKTSTKVLNLQNKINKEGITSATSLATVSSEYGRTKSKKKYVPFFDKTRMIDETIAEQYDMKDLFY